MIIDKDEFFREVTLRISSSLQIGTALRNAFVYLRDHFPLDDIYLDMLDQNLGAIRRIAHIAAVEQEAQEEIVPLPEGLWEWLKKKRSPFIVLQKDTKNYIRSIEPLIKLKGNSDILLPLLIDGDLIGFLVLRSRGENRYTPGHVELLATVSEPFSIALANALAHQTVVKYRDTLLDDNLFLKKELFSQVGDEIIGGNSGLRHVMVMVRQIAPLNNTVLLMGETGTGKEVIANAIHFASARKDGPFIKVNCGAIPIDLIDSELFGHEKGAFTGAVAEKRGRFERADGGTIFLDEIGELTPQAQVRLLRVLQNHEIERVGGNRPKRVDIRVIAATHRNLEGMVLENQFREDLWFRLNVFPIILPPLRQRTEDIPKLVTHFIVQKSRELGIAPQSVVAPGALERLMRYSWPGNVREMENLVEREIIRHRGEKLMFDTLLTEEGSKDLSREEENGLELPLRLDEAMAYHISRVLKITKGRINGPGGAAEILGINPNTLRGRMKKLSISYGRGKG